MKVTLVYTLVLGKSDANAPDPSYYDKYTHRFIQTYCKFPAGEPHSVCVCCCGGKVTETVQHLFAGMAGSYAEYFGGGWDIGAYQSVNATLDCDLAVFMAAPVHFVRSDWLKPIVAAASKYGPGIYGPQTSYENNPHIRTGCFACTPAVLRSYPHVIDARNKCVFFECGYSNPEWNLATWGIKHGHPVKMVSATGVYDRNEWRIPPNIFRRGNQSNCLIWDRHNDIYADASQDEKLKLAQLADGKD